METYVELKGSNLKFESIDEAIEEAEHRHFETTNIYVYSENGKLLEWQTAKRSPHSGELVYSTWGVFKAEFNDDGKIMNAKILREGINSRKEAIDLALDLMDYGVFIQDYSQTLSINIGGSNNKPMYIHLATKNVWLATSPDAIEDSDDAEYICTLNIPDTLEDVIKDLKNYEPLESESYDDCWKTGNYED